MYIIIYCNIVCELVKIDELIDQVIYLKKIYTE